MPCTLEVRLKPRAKKDLIQVGNQGGVDISVTSPPLENKANEHLIRILADRLDLPKRALKIIKGEHNRNKVVAIEDLTPDELQKRLQQ